MSIRPVLLDTCAFIWLFNNDKLLEEAAEALAEMELHPGGVTVSPITAWEIGQLVSRGRLRLPTDPASWFEIPVMRGLALAAMPPSVLVAASFLPGQMLRDPADRIIAATARAFGYRIMTRDRALLDFAAEGHAQVIAC